LPKIIKNNAGGWKDKDPIEFFVDFETCNTCMGEMNNLPRANNHIMIYMIGVGYELRNASCNKWIYKCFVVDRLNEEEEERIANNFVKYIRKVSKRYGVQDPKCYHWSPAEPNMWKNYGGCASNINWTDLMCVFKEEPVVIRGCMSFGLKNVAKAMYKHKFIETTWINPLADGKGAMLSAFEGDKIAKKKGIRMKDTDIIQDVVRYNEVDVKVLWEILLYLRTNHTVSTSKKRKRVSDDEDYVSKRRK
jgi:predicted RecB family nuclease